jgi:hypothetical protein
MWNHFLNVIRKLKICDIDTSDVIWERVAGQMSRLKEVMTVKKWLALGTAAMVILVEINIPWQYTIFRMNIV